MTVNKFIRKLLNLKELEVRKEQWRKATVVERKALKGLRWFLFRHLSTCSKYQTRILDQLRQR